MECSGTLPEITNHYNTVRSFIFGYINPPLTNARKEAFDSLEILMNIVRSRPDWPKDIYEQYIRTLDERDKAIERAEKSEELLRYLRELLY